MMLSINELFKPHADSLYKVERTASQSSFQTYKLTPNDGGEEYQIKFDNIKNFGKQVQVIRIGQVTPNQKKMKPLIKKIVKPLDFFTGLKELMNQHSFGDDPVAKQKLGFVAVIQQDKFSVPLPVLTKIAKRLLFPEFEIVQQAYTPTAAQLGGVFPKDGEFVVIAFKRKVANTYTVFAGPDGETFTGAAVAADPAPLAVKATPASEPEKKVEHKIVGASDKDIAELGNYQIMMLDIMYFPKLIASSLAAGDVDTLSYLSKAVTTSDDEVKLAKIAHYILTGVYDSKDYTLIQSWISFSKGSNAAPAPAPAVASNKPYKFVPSNQFSWEQVKAVYGNQSIKTSVGSKISPSQMAFAAYLKNDSAEVASAYHLANAKGLTVSKKIISAMYFLMTGKKSLGKYGFKAPTEGPKGNGDFPSSTITTSSATAAPTAIVPPTTIKKLTEEQYVQLQKFFAGSSISFSKMLSSVDGAKAGSKTWMDDTLGTYGPSFNTYEMMFFKVMYYIVTGKVEVAHAQVIENWKSWLEANGAPAPATKVETAQYFYSPIIGPNSNGTSLGSKNIFLIKDGISYGINGAQTPQPLGVSNIVFASESAAENALAGLNSQAWHEALIRAAKVKVAKVSGLPSGIEGGETYDVLVYTVGTFLKPITAAEFLGGLAKRVFVYIKSDSGGATIALDQIYKFIYTDGVTATNPLMGKDLDAVASPDPSAVAKPVINTAVAKKAPGENIANGLRAKNIDAATLQWLTENPPPGLEDGKKTIPEWKEYAGAFKELGALDIEVGGFQIKFTTSNATKLFQQIDNISKFATGAELDAVKDALKEAFNVSKSTLRAKLSAIQKREFPSNSAIQAYTGSSYGSMNQVLRGGEDEYNVKEKLKSADNYFRKHGRPLDPNVVVYRGQSVLVGEIKGLLQGKEYVLHGFVSTSLSLDIANSFMGTGYGNHLNADNVFNGKAVNVTMDTDFDSLSAAAGNSEKGDGKKFKVMLVISGLDKCLSVIPGEWGSHESECEIVLNRGARLKLNPHVPIKQLTSSDGTNFIIYCTIVGDGKIEYKVNEMTTLDEQQEKKAEAKFSDRVKAREMADNVEKLKALHDFAGKKENVKQHPKWNDDILS